MAKILVTGAFGHIGSRLIHSIKPKDFEEVWMMDNMSTQRYSSLFNLPYEVNFRFIEDDICTANLDHYFKNIDIVIHLAALTDASSSSNDPRLYEKVNYFGVEKVAQACIRNNCRLFFPSTTSVYGVQMEVVDENCHIDELKPQSPYAEAKLKAELLLSNLSKNNELRHVTCRFGTIFGTSIGMRFHTAVNKFCWQAVMGQPLTVWSSALNQRRPYLDLIDAIRCISFIIENDLFDGRIYNVVTTNSTVADLIKIISSHIPNPTISMVNSEIMNQLSYTVYSERIQDEGFKYIGDINKGIEETIKLLQNAHLNVK